MPFVEVSHGDGLGGSSLNYGLPSSDELALIAAAADVVERGTLAALLLPGIGTRDDLARVRELGVGLVRVATHCTEADIAEQHLTMARELGMTAVGFLMMAHMSEPEALAEQARIMSGAGAEVVYVTDSAGSAAAGTAARVAALRRRAPGGPRRRLPRSPEPLARRRELARRDRRRRDLDRLLHVRARRRRREHAAEVFVAVCDRAGVETGVDVFALMDAAEEVVRPLLPRARSSIARRCCWATPASTRRSCCSRNERRRSMEYRPRTSWSNLGACGRSEGRRT